MDEQKAKQNVKKKRSALPIYAIGAVWLLYAKKLDSLRGIVSCAKRPSSPTRGRWCFWRQCWERSSGTPSAMPAQTAIILVCKCKKMARSRTAPGRVS